ncbi:MAG: diguanylate cyclase [Proteobacteria bacterium]|nr:diguanylate cyclase [Pseudomonadota bacterium]
MIKQIKTYFLGLSIAKKMLLGYFPLSALMFFTALYALSSLEKLNTINESIINTDIKLIESTKKMIDSTLAQELYGMRYIILKSQDMKSVFYERMYDFKNKMEEISVFSDIDAASKVRLKLLHDEYNGLFMTWFRDIENSTVEKKSSFESQIKKKQDELISLIKKINLKAHQNRNQKTLMTAAIGDRAFAVIAVLCILSVLFGIGVAMSITRYISGAINRLKVATHQIAEGKFENIPKINNRDEIGELSFDLSAMANQLKNLKEIHLAASPLTNLPGGVSIENFLGKRISQGTLFAFVYCDLDNFKVYSDHYGYASGSEVIKATGLLIEEVMADYGEKDDFIGHIGGDDFVIITSVTRYEDICLNIIKKFDKMIIDHYDDADKYRGYITGKTRQGEEREFPIISISIAVVTNEKRTFRDHIQVGESAANLKEHVKSIPGSTYMVDRRIRD